METILLVAQSIVVIALVVTVLLQPSSTDGMGALGGGGGGGGHGLISSRATANILTKITKWLAIFLMANSLGLAWLFAHNNQTSRSLLLKEEAPLAVDGAIEETAPAIVPEEAEQIPSAPLAE